VVGSTLAHVFVEDLRRRERVRDVLAGIDGVTVLDEAFLKRHGLAIPERNGDIVIAAQPPDRFSRPGGAAGAYLRARLAMGASIGGHGYRPELEDMGGIFLAYARGVKRGARIGAVRQVDVAATVAKLLAIEPPLASEGIPITLNGER